MAKAARPRDIVYSALKRRIVLNEIRPGEPLTELGLAGELECSMQRIRICSSTGGLARRKITAWKRMSSSIRP